MYKLHDQKTEHSTEALVRLMSVYLGSAPGTLNDCEIFNRGDMAMKYLSNAEICLDSSLVKESFLTGNGPGWVKNQKEIILKKIEIGDSDWCSFDY